MHFLFDGRSLQSASQSGVPRVARFALYELARVLGSNTLTVLTSAWQKPKLELPVNIHHQHLNLPNRLLNASLAFFERPRLELMLSADRPPIDAIFFPNLHYIACGAPYVALVHDLSFLIEPAWFSWRQRLAHSCKRPRVFFRNADSLLAVSKTTAEDISRIIGRDDAQVVDISGTVKFDFKTLETDVQNIVAWKPYLLFIGTTEARKNLSGIIRGFLEWRARQVANADSKAVKLIIAGELTTYGRMLRKQCSDQTDILWLGTVSETTKNQLIKNARALMYPSFYEGFGLPLLEAEKVGIPIISSNQSALSEIASPKILLADPYRPSTIAQGLDLIFKDDLPLENSFDPSATVSRGLPLGETILVALTKASNHRK